MSGKRLSALLLLVVFSVATVSLARAGLWVPAAATLVIAGIDFFWLRRVQADEAARGSDDKSPRSKS